MQSLILVLTKLAPFLIQGNPDFFRIPALAGMTRYALINVAMYKTLFLIQRVGVFVFSGIYLWYFGGKKDMLMFLTEYADY